MMIVEDLNLHPLAANVPRVRRADIDAAIAVRLEPILEAHFEVGVIARGAEPPAAAALADQKTVFDGPRIFLGRVLLPAGQVGAVEERDKAVGFFALIEL